MPSETYYAGGRLFPIESAGTNSAIEDGVVMGLLSYFGFWLKAGLDAKLSEMQGPTTSAAVEDACPVENRFPWDHNGTFMRPHNTGETSPAVALPGLWLWEESAERTREGATLWNDYAIVRTLRMHWVFPQVQIPGGFAARSGLLTEASRIIAKACFEKRHPSYTPTGSAAGTSIVNALGILGLELVSATPGRLSVLPSGGTAGNLGRPGNEGVVQRFYPALNVALRTWERVGEWLADATADKMQDGSILIRAGDNTADTADLLERVVIAPDDTP